MNDETRNMKNEVNLYCNDSEDISGGDLPTDSFSESQ